MTDATLATGDLSSAEPISNDIKVLPNDSIDNPGLLDAAVVEPEAPNGFIALDLAPELIRAVKDLGFTQPTIVQQKTIPLAMQGHSAGANDARFIDLMVSSQTGSGKKAAVLPLFCCPCCTPC